ncbi:MAG TPA: maleylpyruvate isomerase N-terminal domain-containing protein, partial [Nocardioides sp.]|nr:maleylpyruvate isomerase N-terminal domain-containing protein [Nocardioides sp.]
MTNRGDELAVLSRGLDQAARLLDEVTEADLTTATPCENWTVADLVDHLVVSPARFAQMVRGEQ